MTLWVSTAHAQLVENFATVTSPIGIDHDPFNNRLIVSRYTNPRPTLVQVNLATRQVSEFADIRALTGSEFYHVVLRTAWGPYSAGTVLVSNTGGGSVLWNVTSGGQASPVATLGAPSSAGYTKVLHDAARNVLYFFDESGNSVYKVSWNPSMQRAEFQRLASVRRPDGGTLLPVNLRYGPWSGKIVATENNGNWIYAIDPDTGAVQVLNRSDVGITIANDLEEVVALPQDALPYLFVCDYGDSLIRRITGYNPGDLLISVESNGRIYKVEWNATQGRFFSTQLPFQFGLLEGMVGVPIPEPASLIALGAGLASLVCLRRRCS